MKDKKEIIRALKFTMFSISAGVIEFIVFTALTLLTKGSYWVCYLPALVASVIWNFTLNREFTFKSAVNVPKAMLKVGIYYLIFTPTSTLLGNYLAETLNWNDFIVTIINMILNFVTEYLYDTYYVFKNEIDTKERKKKNEKN